MDDTVLVYAEFPWEIGKGWSLETYEDMGAAWETEINRQRKYQIFPMAIFLY